MVSAIDFSWARPNPQAIKAAGVTYVLRYLARGGGGKVLSAEEAKRYLDIGLGVALNFEQEADAPKKGMERGIEDARFANSLADQIGAPKDAWIWYSCDTSANYSEIAPYYDGVKRVGGRPSAYYGGFPVGLQLKQKGLVQAVWCANAASWSGYRSWNAMADAARAASVHMIQHLDHPLPGLNANDYDYNEVLHMSPMWGLAHPPEPTPTPDEDPEEELMIALPQPGNPGGRIPTARIIKGYNCVLLENGGHCTGSKPVANSPTHAQVWIPGNLPPGSKIVGVAKVEGERRIVASYAFTNNDVGTYLADLP